eukprot:TRINITY_DN6377_c0_g1_i1.p1 TRINITY_DN6377_c0_g1~~TRINITY_DN6377_c0_g1_i1.p1  ORF type:complete len:1311 (+),score=255.40 TRINITY_DN6377_c0_g1_i1:44-3976(+)
MRTILGHCGFAFVLFALAIASFQSVGRDRDRSTKSPCDYGTHELLSMKMEDAFSILMSLHSNVCLGPSWEDDIDQECIIQQQEQQQLANANEIAQEMGMVPEDYIDLSAKTKPPGDGDEKHPKKDHHREYHDPSKYHNKLSVDKRISLPDETNLFPFNVNGDAGVLTGFDEKCIDMFPNVNIMFYGESRTILYGCTNGVISLTPKDPGYSSPIMPASGPIVIAPFWADTDLSSSVDEKSGRIYYERIALDSEYASEYEEIIRENFPDQESFSATDIFLITYYRVYKYGSKQNYNTFQAAVAIQNQITFVFHRYATNGIQWYQVSGGTGYPALAVNAGDEFNYHAIPYSATSEVPKAAQESNVNRTGIWAFRVDTPLPFPDPSNQRTNLMRFFTTMGGANWPEKYGWGTATKIFLWFGVYCSTGCTEEQYQVNSCPVVKIVLESNQLEGDISAALLILKEFTYLEEIKLNGNWITGSIQDFSFPMLKKFEVGGNYISGLIPNFSGMPLLESLVLLNNPLSGTLHDFNNLPKLTSLGIGGSEDITGTIPNFKYMPLIDTIYIGDCNVYGSIPFFNNTVSLENLYLFGNRLTGPLPDNPNTPLLDSVLLSINELSGTIPNFQHYKRLTGLILNNNLLTGTIPNFSDLSRLSALYLSFNKLTGTLPEFDAVPQLAEILAYENELNGAVPNFKNLSSLVDLSLMTNKLTGPVQNFDSLPKLNILKLSNNYLEGTIPSLRFLGSLQILVLTNNKLNGSIPALTSLSGLKELNLGINQLSGQLPSFSAMPLLETLSLYDNLLTGMMNATSFANGLKHLRIFNNRLVGSVPRLSLSSLETLDISRNQFTGTLDSRIQIPSAKYIDFSNNLLTGSIPPPFGTLKNLQTILLSGNKFEGQLPDALWMLSNMVSLDLSDNNFSGDVGEFIVSSTDSGRRNYQSLLLDNNKLSGVLNWRVFGSTGQIQQLSLRNNNITRMGGLTSNLLWKRLDLSGNPLEGPIPESYSNFLQIDYLGALAPNLHHENNTLLPGFMRYTNQYNLEDRSKLFICPTIESNLNTTSTDISLMPSYYDHVFCQCLPNYFGFAGKCIECQDGCECPDGLSLKKCFASPDVRTVASLTPCPNVKACHAIISPTHPNAYAPEEPSTVCKEGYTDRVCSKCQSGYGMRGRSCIECDQASVYLSVFLMPCGVILFLFYLYKMQVKGTAKLRIIIFHSQTLSILSRVFSISDESDSTQESIFSIGSLQLPNLACVLESSSPVDILAFSYSRILLIIFAFLVFFHTSKGYLRDKVRSCHLSLLMASDSVHSCLPHIDHGYLIL